MKIHLLQYLEKTYAKYKDKVAIIDKNRQLTFSELRNQSLGISIKLKKQNNDIYNQPIAVFLPKSLESIVSYTAILYSGGFYVPLDSKSPIERVESIIKTLSPQVIITNQSLKEKLLKINYPADKIIEIEPLIQTIQPEDVSYQLPLNHID
ncbi:MAG: AMP-binding protein, partial [Carboxylicivirga sp.]|nr:AMP-binding protein [Carboxylicivirga sp.]